MNSITQSQDLVNGTDQISMGIMLIIALAGSCLLTALIWKLGVIRFMTNVQNQRQARMDSAFDEVENHPEKYTEKQKKMMEMVGRKQLYTAYWGTGKSATLSFLGAIWLISFSLIMFGLIFYA